MFRDRKDAGRKLGRALEEYKNCDGLVLEQPMFFRAAAQAYQNWYDVPDTEVVEIMQKSRQLELHSHQR